MNVPLVMFMFAGLIIAGALWLEKSAHYSLKGADRLCLLFFVYSFMFLLSNG